MNSDETDTVVGELLWWILYAQTFSSQRIIVKGVLYLQEKFYDGCL